MKLPEYSLTVGIEFKNDSMNSKIEFQSGTLVQPFWNEGFLPSERKKELEEARLYSYPDKEMVMCLIGRYWVPIHKAKIRKSLW